MSNIDLNNVLSKLKANLKADWVGLREVKETTTHRIIRDLNPASNNTSIDHGVMVEVLVNGQFGYYGTHNISEASIVNAANQAYNQAKSASKYPIHSFTEEVRPKSIGSYSSQYELQDVSLDSLMDTLLLSNKAVRSSEKIVAAIKQEDVVGSATKSIQIEIDNLTSKIDKLLGSYRVVVR